MKRNSSSAVAERRRRSGSPSSSFETLESRRLLSAYMVNLFPAPIIVNGTSGNDFIQVNYSNNPLTGARVHVRVNPTFENPGYVLFPNPGQPVIINGLGGNDKIQYSGSLGVTIYGGPGNDTLIGGSGSDRLYGEAGNDVLDGGLGSDYLSGGVGSDTVTYASRTTGVRVTVDGVANDGAPGEGDIVMEDVEVLIGGSGHDYLSFANSTTAWHKLEGNAGNDTLIGSEGPDLILDGPGDDLIEGRGGSDILFGTSGNDTIFGGDGADLITGGLGNDVLHGNAGLDTIHGDEGHDTIFGGAGNDMLYGGTGNDILRGEAGADLLFGQDGHDRLYGGDGIDTLHGGNGNDGLFGGAGNDELWGNAGHDRFLFQTGDIIKDLTSTDARVNFVNGQQTTLTFAGQDGSYTYAAANWTDADVESADTALHVLHQSVGNTRMLKRPNRTELTFVRQGQLIASTGGSFVASGWNSNGRISLVSLSAGTIFHEIGHNWDRHDETNWNALSGWTQADMSSNSNFVRGKGNDGWWHLASAQFASEYAKTNPREDFSESFVVNMIKRAGLPGAGFVVTAKNSFIDGMLNTLAANP